jgi:alpha-beta hydrolase superfamily lysophospholipase
LAEGIEGTMVKEHTEKTITTSDGTSIYMQSWKSATAASSTTAHLIVVHGYLEHSGRYREFATSLSDSIACTVYDCRGHGKSAGRPGYVRSYADYRDDLQCVLDDVIREMTASVPIFILGHSNGALIVLDYFQTIAQQPPPDTAAAGDHHRDIQGVIVTSPWLAPAEDLPYAKVLASKVLGRCWSTFSMPASEASAATLMHDEEKRREHENDKSNLTHFTVGWALQSMITQKKVRENLKELPLPLLFAYAGKDMVASTSVNKNFAEELKADDKIVIEREEEYHEILNETNRKELFGIIEDWIQKHV